MYYLSCIHQSNIGEHPITITVMWTQSRAERALQGSAVQNINIRGER